MNKSQLLDWLQGEYPAWEGLLDQIGSARMQRPGVNGDWTMKDLVGHLTGRNCNLLARLQAAARREAQPPPPWPIHLRTDHEINAWVYASYRGRSLSNVLTETEQVFQEILAVVQQFPRTCESNKCTRRGESIILFGWGMNATNRPNSLSIFMMITTQMFAPGWRELRTNRPVC